MFQYTSVFDNQTLTIQRKGQAYLNADRDLIIPDVDPFTISCDIQPLSIRMYKQLEAPSGFTLEAGLYVSSKSTLRTMDEVGDTAADQTVYRGRTYYVWALCDWSGGPLSTDYYKDYYLVMKRRPNEGAL